MLTFEGSQDRLYGGVEGHDANAPIPRNPVSGLISDCPLSVCGIRPLMPVSQCLTRSLRHGIGAENGVGGHVWLRELQAAPLRSRPATMAGSAARGATLSFGPAE